jgi:hypothetical protein
MFSGAIGLAAGGLLLSAGAAGAAVEHPAAGHVPRLLTSPPPGYTVVAAGPYTAPAHAQTIGGATCPSTRELVGGAVAPYNNTTTMDVNSSYPAGGTWVVRVNNNGATASKFDVWAFCLKAGSGYTVVSSQGYANAGATDFASAACPSLTVVVGGGVWASGGNLGIGINSSVGNKTGPGHFEWTAALSNTSSSGDPFNVYAICRPRPAGYAMVTGQPVSVHPGGTGEPSAACPGLNSLPLSGGGFTTYQTTDSGLAFNLTVAGTGDWATLWENSGKVTRSAYATVICAGT